MVKSTATASSNRFSMETRVIFLIPGLFIFIFFTLAEHAG